MPCFKPLRAYRFHAAPGPLFNHKSGKPKLIFDESRIEGYLKVHGDSHEILTLPCGQCEGCFMDYAADWKTRVLNETMFHDRNSFLTLTYDTPHLPPNRSLEPKDLQDFWKRLRYHLYAEETYLKIHEPYYGPWKPIQIKYFSCGEYGDEKGRPHYHAVLFGWDFPDKVEVKNNPWAKDPLYESPTLNKIWGHGVCKIGNVSGESAAYTARYAMKKIRGKEGKAAYEAQGKHPPFITMSQGIGRRYFNKYASSIYALDSIRDPETKTNNPVPRFYDKLMQEAYPEKFERLKRRRQDRINKLNPADQTPERLETRHECLKLRLKKMQRNLDKHGDKPNPSQLETKPTGTQRANIQAAPNTTAKENPCNFLFTHSETSKPDTT